MNGEPRRRESTPRKDEALWHELLERHTSVVRRVCSGFASFSASDVDELVQETFVHAFEHLGEIRDPARTRPWLLAVARSRCLKRLRSRGVEARALDQLAEAPVAVHPALDVEAERRRRIELVRELVDALPEGPERQTVQLFYLDGTLSAREIAERLGVGKSTVTMRLERFRARIKRQLAARLAIEEDGR